MRRLNPECSDSESSDPSLPADLLLREEPDDEEEEDEDDRKKKMTTMATQTMATRSERARG